MTGTTRILALIFSGLVLLLSCSAQPMPQTARQALVEMFFSKTPGTFEKHLPQVIREALRKAGTAPGTSLIEWLSAMTSQLSARGQQLQTFEAGPTLISIEDPGAHTKFEITVERDDLQADEDEIELSFHGYKDGEAQIPGTKFRFTFSMKQEAGSWRLQDVTVAVRVSLTNPAFLKAMTTDLKAISTGSSEISVSAPPAMAVTNAVNEGWAIGALRTLNTAEVTYAATFGGGFTCALSDLGGMGGGGAPSPHQAMLIDPRLAGGKKNGYVFALSGCDGNPAARYSISAAPADLGSGARAFCSDESGVIRYSSDGKVNSCLSAGKPL